MKCSSFIENFGWHGNMELQHDLVHSGALSNYRAPRNWYVPPHVLLLFCWVNYLGSFMSEQLGVHHHFHLKKRKKRKEKGQKFTKLCHHSHFNDGEANLHRCCKWLNPAKILSWLRWRVWVWEQQTSEPPFIWNTSVIHAVNYGSLSVWDYGEQRGWTINEHEHLKIRPFLK